MVALHASPNLSGLEGVSAGVVQAFAMVESIVSILKDTRRESGKEFHK